MFEHPIIKN